MSLYENKNNELTEWRMLVKLGLLQIKPAIMEEIFVVRQKLFQQNERVMGVHLRGTDYISKRLRNHPIPPQLNLR